MKYNFKKYTRQMGNHYDGLRLGPSYFNLTLKAHDRLREEGKERVFVYFDKDLKLIALKPTDSREGLAINQSVSCRLLKHMPWGRYYFIKKDSEYGFIYQMESQK